MDLYRDILMDHYTHPRNQGSLSVCTHQTIGQNPLCGDSVELSLLIKDGKIVDIKQQTQGCAITIASTSLLTEAVKGKTLEQVKNMNIEDVLKLLGTSLTTTRRQCAQVALTALQSVLKTI